MAQKEEGIHTNELDISMLVISTFCHVNLFLRSKGKGKAILLQAWTGPKVSRRLRLPYFKTIGT